MHKNYVESRKVQQTQSLPRVALVSYRDTLAQEWARIVREYIP